MHLVLCLVEKNEKNCPIFTSNKSIFRKRTSEYFSEYFVISGCTNAHCQFTGFSFTFRFLSLLLCKVYDVGKNR